MSAGDAAGCSEPGGGAQGGGRECRLAPADLGVLPRPPAGEKTRSADWRVAGRPALSFGQERRSPVMGSTFRPYRGWPPARGRAALSDGAPTPVRSACPAFSIFSPLYLGFPCNALLCGLPRAQQNALGRGHGAHDGIRGNGCDCVALSPGISVWALAGQTYPVSRVRPANSLLLMCPKLRRHSGQPFDQRLGLWRNECFEPPT